MSEKQLWVTAYQCAGREIIKAQAPQWLEAMYFEFNQHLEPNQITKAELDAMRASGVSVTYYSIPNPF